MTTTWLLIIYLSTGGIDRVIPVDNQMDCVIRSQFEMRHNPLISSTSCVLVVAGGVEA